jgi:dethiobiotin synthetase
MSQKIVIAGIDTEIGKTVVSAIFCQALKADYWKPVQAGDLHYTDSHRVEEWTKNTKTIIHPEAARLKHPMSPHAAADIEGIKVNLKDLKLPETNNDLIIELAGGLMVPINHQELNIDLLAELKIPVVLVSKYYLGNINHTLLSWQLLKDRNIPFLGFVFNGRKNEATFDIILEYTKEKCLLEIEQHEQIDEQLIRKYAERLSL